MTDPQKKADEQVMRALWTNWREKIRRDLDAHRPKRYDRGETDWMDGIVARARGTAPEEDALIIRRHVEREVRNLESQAMRRGNALVREWYEGRRPLAWELFGALPILVGGTKVRLDAASRQDVRDAVDQAHADNLANYNRAELGLAGYRELERRAAAQGYEQLSLLGDLPPYEKGGSAESQRKAG